MIRRQRKLLAPAWGPSQPHLPVRPCWASFFVSDRPAGASFRALARTPRLPGTPIPTSGLLPALQISGHLSSPPPRDSGLLGRVRVQRARRSGVTYRDDGLLVSVRQKAPLQRDPCPLSSTLRVSTCRRGNEQETLLSGGENPPGRQAMAWHHMLPRGPESSLRALRQHTLLPGTQPRGP